MNTHPSITAILAKQRAADLRRAHRPRIRREFWAEAAPAASTLAAFAALFALAHPYM